MLFTECFQEVSALESTFDTNFKKIGIFVEAVTNELEINKKEAMLKVMQESGTDSDLCTLYEAATEESNNRIIMAIKKLIDNLISFLDDMKDTISKTFMRGEVADTIAKAEKVASENPKLKSAKVEYYDSDDEVSLLRKFSDKVSSKIARVKVNHFAQKDIDELKDEQQSVETKRQKMQKIKVTITVAGALALISKLVKKVDDECESGTTDAKNKKRFLENSEMESAQAHALQSCYAMSVQATKEMTSSIFRSLKSLVSGVKDALHGAQKSEPKTESVNTETELGAEDGVLQESAEESKVFDDAAYLNNLEAALFKEAEEPTAEGEETPTENTDEPAGATTERTEEGAETSENQENAEPVQESEEDYISSLEKEIFGDAVVKESEEANDTGVVEDIDSMIEGLEGELAQEAAKDEPEVPFADKLLAEMDQEVFGNE